MSSKTDLRKVHNFLWLGHGVLTVLLALLLMAIEGPFTELLGEINNGHNDAELDVIIAFMSMFFSTTGIMLMYGLAVCVLISAYHFRPALFKLPMFLFIAAHVPVSIYVNWAVYDVLSPLEDGIYSILFSIISSEVVLVVCLVLSWVYIARADRPAAPAVSDHKPEADEQAYEDEDEPEA